MKTLFVAIPSLLLTGCSLVGIRTVEQADYRVIDEDGRYEIRQYEDAIVAETVVEPGTWRDEGNVAFNRLAGYIFGRNQRSEKIAMTAPVMQEPQGEKIAMTAPVTQSEGAEGSTWAFVMPSKYSIDELPEPLDPNVELRVREGRRVAVIRYSGFITDNKREKFALRLLDWVDRNDLIPVSAPIHAGYDPPWTVPFLRRNEVMVEIQ